ncbi:MAG: hypothetical protein RLY43_737 [Bacteroidota bacterium]|jgi:acetyltransferase-like isoleucine patch superfamily enzyme
MKTIKNLLKFIFFRFKFRKSQICYGASVDNSSALGDFVKLFENVKIENSEIGKFTYIQANSIIRNTVIGPYCSIATNVIVGPSQHPMHFLSTSPVFYDPRQPLPKFLNDSVIYSEEVKYTRIGADVWIGEGVKILSPVIIGVGSIIAAGSVVTKDVLPYSIVGGVPAKFIKHRFSSQDLIDKLIQSEWWNLPVDTLQNNSHYFSEPLIFLEKLNDKNF